MSNLAQCWRDIRSNWWAAMPGTGFLACVVWLSFPMPTWMALLGTALIVTAFCGLALWGAGHARRAETSG